VARWCDLFNADFDVLPCDLASTYFEINNADVPEGDKRRHGYSRDKRPDCPQVMIALVVTDQRYAGSRLSASFDAALIPGE
jgi:hypothetical protein